MKHDSIVCGLSRMARALRNPLPQEPLTVYHDIFQGGIALQSIRKLVKATSAVSSPVLSWAVAFVELHLVFGSSSVCRMCFDQVRCSSANFLAFHQLGARALLRCSSQSTTAWQNNWKSLAVWSVCQETWRQYDFAHLRWLYKLVSLFVHHDCDSDLWFVRSLETHVFLAVFLLCIGCSKYGRLKDTGIIVCSTGHTLEYKDLSAFWSLLFRCNASPAWCWLIFS